MSKMGHHEKRKYRTEKEPNKTSRNKKYSHWNKKLSGQVKHLNNRWEENLVHCKINEKISQNASQRDKTMGNMKDKLKDMKNRKRRSRRHLIGFLGDKKRRKKPCLKW